MDHAYTQFRIAYKPLLRPPFGKSDHSSILLVPAYKHRLKTSPPITRTCRCWSDESDAILQDCFDSMTEFAENSGDVNEIAEGALGLIGKVIEEVVPTKTVRVYPNRKPWINFDVNTALTIRKTAFKTGDTTEIKDARYNLRKVIKAAKRDYGKKIEAQLSSNDPRRMWKGLHTITDFKETSSCTADTSVSLPDELNSFYARFEVSQTSLLERTYSEDADNTASALVITEEDVRVVFKRINIRKAAGSDGLPGRVFKVCADQLAGVFTNIFNLSLSTGIVPACFKSSVIIPVQKKSKVTYPNDWRPVALTPIVSKCFEKLIKVLICRMLPPALDPHQFAYRKNKSTDDAIATALHLALAHLDKRNTYVRMLFVDYSSAFNTIVPSRLDRKLRDLGIDPSLCNWILDFLTDRKQVVKMGPKISAPLTISTGAPQGCVLSPLLYSLYTHDCVATHGSNTVIKFADDTTVMGLITDGDETAYRSEVDCLAQNSQDNNLILNTDKTKELVVDFRKKRQIQHPISINGSAVERVHSIKFLGVHITRDLTWEEHTNQVVKKAQRRLFHLRRLKKFGVGPKILGAFFRGTTESILTGCITAWYGNCTAQSRKMLQRVVRTAERISGCELPSIQETYKARCVRKALRIIGDPSHPNQKLFELLPSGRRYQSLRAKTQRMTSSFFPQAVRLLEKHTTPQPSTRTPQQQTVVTF